MNQAIKDAQADAETLRRIVKVTHAYTRTQTFQAEARGEWAAQEVSLGYVGSAQRLTVLAAHAAFRAVPELRG